MENVFIGVLAGRHMELNKHYSGGGEGGGGGV